LVVDGHVFAVEEELADLFAHAIEFVRFNIIIAAQVEIDPVHHVLDPHQDLVAHFVRFDVEKGSHPGTYFAPQRFLVEF